MKQFLLLTLICSVLSFGQKVNSPHLTVLDNTNPSQWFIGDVHCLQCGDWQIQVMPNGDTILTYNCTIGNISDGVDWIVPRFSQLANFLQINLRKLNSYEATIYKSNYDLSTDCIPNFGVCGTNQYDASTTMWLNYGKCDEYYNGTPALHGSGYYLLRVTLSSAGNFQAKFFKDNTKFLPFYFDSFFMTARYAPEAMKMFFPHGQPK